MEKKVYHTILQKNAIPSDIRLIRNGFIFQEDNDPKHSSNYCRNYLSNKEKSGILRRIIWPPQSPERRSHRNVVGGDRKVKQSINKYKASDLWDCLQETWKSIDATIINKLIARMPRLCRAVIKAKGGFFDESRI